MAIVLFTSKLIVSSGLLYGYYHLFLRNKRFHHYNRFYLLAISLLSFIIPFVHIPVNLFTGSQQHSTFIQTLKVINANGWEEPVTVYARQNQWSKLVTVQGGLYLMYTLGLLTGLFFLVRSFAWINGLKRKYGYERVDDIKIYNTTEPGTPFSFFKSIFWDTKIPLNNKQGQQIFRHELFHVKEKHSADILVMEIICCIAWFNPFFHLIKKEIKAIHEFLADEYAVSVNNRYDYAELLILHAINQKAPSLSHPFFHHQIKRRIIMITQSNLVSRTGYLSRMMAIPLLFVLVSAFAVKFTNHHPNTHSSKYADKNITVVIDAGHGGIFPGTRNADKIFEKDITLSIAQKIKALAAGYNVNIVLTRNNDRLVGNATNLKEDLMNRIQVANDVEAALYISIHVNASIGEKTTLSGFDAYVSGKKDATKAKQLATTILTGLKTIYTVNDTIQQRQVGVQVLDKSSCPAILLECGYLTNPTDAAFITNPANQEKIARKILEGIVQYSTTQTGEGIIQKDTVIKINYTTANRVVADTMVRVTYSIHDLTTTSSVPAREAAVITKVKFEADYPGGQADWIKYLTTDLHYPGTAVKKNIQGAVVMQFIVNSDGKISNVPAISGPEALKAVSIRAIEQSGVWVPA